MRATREAGVVLWVDGPRDVVEQMAIDVRLLERAGCEGGPAVLRLYTFSPPGITLGRAQDPVRELDTARCARESVSWAVRPTGGRAIFHDEDWTFAAAGSSRGGWLAGRPAAAYARTAELFARALERLGARVELTPGTPGGPGRPRDGAGPAPPCFATSARHELTRDGRKIAGLAQREASGARLQQGSVLVGDAHVRLADFLAVPDTERARAGEELRRASAPLSWGPAPVPGFDAFADAVERELRPDAVWVGDAPFARGILSRASAEAARSRVVG